MLSDENLITNYVGHKVDPRLTCHLTLSGIAILPVLVLLEILEELVVVFNPKVATSSMYFAIVFCAIFLFTFVGGNTSIEHQLNNIYAE